MMKKGLFFLFFVAVLGTAGISLACQAPNCGPSGPQATAEATSVVQNNLSLPQHNTTNSASVSAVDINTQNTLKGGDAVAIGVGAPGQASARIGDIQISLDASENNTYVSHNRQHIIAPTVPPLPNAQMFEQYEHGSWNLLDGRKVTFGPQQVGTVTIQYYHYDVQFFKKYEPVDTITTCGVLTDLQDLSNKYFPCSGEIIGYGTIQLTHEYTSKHGKLFLINEGKKGGADQFEVTHINGRKVGSLSTWSAGFSGASSALMGPADEIAGSVGGGTGTGASQIRKVTEPWVTGYFWRSDVWNKEPVSPKKLEVTEQASPETPTELKIQIQ